MKVTAVALLAAIAWGATPAAWADMTPEEAANVARVTTYFEQLSRGDWKTASQLYAPDAKNFGRPVGRAVLARIMEDIVRTFPDVKVRVVEIVARADQVYALCKFSGTHEGVGQLPIDGGLLVGVPPTHKHFENDVVHIFTFRNGSIINHVGVRDDLAMMTQLGLSPAPAPFDWAAFAQEANKKP
ncbi:MAG: ester cyclase [Steroidobacteraceae bacterium]